MFKSNIENLSTKISSITKYYWKERKILLDKEVNSVILRKVTKQNNDLLLTLSAIATYKNSLYVIKVLLKDIYKKKFTNNKDFLEILKTNKVQLDCNCMAFHYQGMRYRLSRIDGAITQTSIRDAQWGKIHQYQNYVCKHLYGVIKNYKTFSKDIKLKLEQEIKKTVIKNGKNK